MEKRVLIAVILCAGIFVAWQQFLAPKPPAIPPAVATAPAGTPAPATPPAAPGSAPAAGAPSGAPAAVPAVNHPEREVELLTPEVRFVLSSAGGTLRHAQLRDPKYFLHKGDPASGYDVVRTLDARTAPFRTSFPGSAFAVPGDTSWEVSQATPNSVVFRAETDAVAIEKRYVVDSARYRLRLDVTVTNKSAKAQAQHLAIQVLTRQDPEGKGSGFFGGSSANTAAILCHVGAKTERTTVEKLSKDNETFEKTGSVLWVGADEKFFLVTAVPHPENPPRDRKCNAHGLPGEVGEGVLSFAERELAPGERTVYPFDLFVGPKIIDDLEKVHPGGEATKLTEAVDVTLAWLSGPILTLLNFFHRFSHNWGLAIILLTVFIKLVTFYPTQRSLLSAKKMQKLGPKMAAIRKKYENDRQRQSVETMNLYKAHGVSPLGGCLPSLIQMPIWIALYSTLNYAVELHRSPFILHIHDLTAKDPFYITPLLMGGVMFLQMKMSPASPDNQQQAMMSVMMPIMFTAFSLVLPSGLALYMLTSYLIGILQQLYINYLDRRSGAKA